MIYLVLVLALVLIAAVAFGAVWFISYGRRSTQSSKGAVETAKAEGPSFHWRYIALPLAILLLSVLLSAYFYHLLPDEVAYHFKFDGTPDRWLSRNIAMVSVLVPQLLLTLLAAATVWVITKLKIFLRQTGTSGIKPEAILPLMGNMVALPQIIVFFAMLDVFSYNSYQTHILPMWIFLLITVGLATIGLVLLFGIIYLRARRQYISPKG